MTNLNLLSVLSSYSEVSLQSLFIVVVGMLVSFFSGKYALKLYKQSKEDKIYKEREAKLKKEAEEKEEKESIENTKIRSLGFNPSYFGHGGFIVASDKVGLGVSKAELKIESEKESSSETESIEYKQLLVVSANYNRKELVENNRIMLSIELREQGTYNNVTLAEKNVEVKSAGKVVDIANNLIDEYKQKLSAA